MPTRAEPHHVSQRSTIALLLVDLLQSFAGREGGQLFEQTRQALQAIRALRRDARSAGVPVIYVNDQEGRWRSSRAEVIERACRARRGDVARALRPAASDYLVLKPGRSGFHQTPLEALLEALGSRRVIIAGVATDVCVLATASDAYQRKLRIAVPCDTSRSLDGGRHQAALDLMAATMKIDIRPAASLALAR